MASPIGPTIPVEYHNIITAGSSKSHFGNNYNNVYHNYAPVPSEENSKTQALIESLWYPEIGQREDQIHDADDSEYRWAFEASSTTLNAWLATANGIFWVAGKAGSGKSTFMKFLRHYAQSECFIEQWSGHRKLIVAAHYFWHAGTKQLQRSREGLYRNVLYQALQSLPEVLPTVFPNRWKDTQRPLINQVGWNNKELQRGLRNLLAVPDTAFAIFIDGLDECDPASEHGVLVEELETFAERGNVKICVSSRPWKPFEPRFKSSTFRLNLHDLTHQDIVRYVSKELANAERDAGLDIGMREHQSTDAGNDMPVDPLGQQDVITSGQTQVKGFQKDRLEASTSSSHEYYCGEHYYEDVSGRTLTVAGKKLVELIASHSEGVFLWVYLILRDLRDEIFAGRQINELENFVHETPSDLMKYYQVGIWKRIGWRKERQVAMALKIVVVLAKAERELLVNSDFYVDSLLSFLPFWHLQTADSLENDRFGTRAPVKEVSSHDFVQMALRTSAFLGEVCRDLIRLQDPVLHVHIPLLRIEFLHRSVLDYLTEPETLAWIDERIPNHFKQPRFLFELFLARIKHVPADVAGSQFICYRLFGI